MTKDQNADLDKFVFRNTSGKPVIFVVEPWVDQIEIPTGSTLEITCDVPAGWNRSTPEAEFQNGHVIFECTGNMYSANLDGVTLGT